MGKVDPHASDLSARAQVIASPVGVGHIAARVQYA